MVDNQQFKDHIMLMNLCNQYKIEAPKLWE